MPEHDISQTGSPLANRTIKNCLLPTFVTRNMRHSNKTQLLAEGDLTSDLRGKKSQLFQPPGLSENLLFQVKFLAVPRLRNKRLNSATLSPRHTPWPTTGVFQVLSAFKCTGGCNETPQRG